MILSPASMMYAFLVVGQGTMAARFAGPWREIIDEEYNCNAKWNKEYGFQQYFCGGYQHLGCSVVTRVAPGCSRLLFVPPKLLYITFLASTGNSLWSHLLSS